MPDRASDRVRCPWAGDDAAMIAYHDREWGVPEHDDRALFALLTLEGAQAGLSWRTILARRDAYRAAFADWDIARIAAFDDRDVERLLAAPAPPPAPLVDVAAGPSIVRNRAKVVATIGNARAALAVIEEWGSLDRLLWSFVDEVVKVGGFTQLAEVPAETDESRAMSRELKRRGFRFVGPTIAYALMQSAGLVNDHLVSCFRFREV